MTQQRVYKFKKGQILDIDEIYFIQGIGSEWWETYDDSNKNFGKGVSGEKVIITKTVTIKTIFITKQD